MIPITVHVPDHKVEEFYIRFGEFLARVPDVGTPIALESGLVPAWVTDSDAQQVAITLWREVSGPGHSVLTFLSENAKNETIRFTPEELAKAVSHPKGVSGIAGILGGVGKAIRRAGLPMYRTATGGDWHYVWGWDGDRYSMTPEVAQLLRRAARAR